MTFVIFIMIWKYNILIIKNTLTNNQNINPSSNDSLENIQNTYDFFYKNLNELEYEHIKCIEKELDFNFSNILTKIKYCITIYLLIICKWKNHVKFFIKLELLKWRINKICIFNI